MGKAGNAFRNTFFIWTYERGTLQYDIICILILAFIFFLPRSCFVKQGISQGAGSAQQQVSRPAPEVER